MTVCLLPDASAQLVLRPDDLLSLVDAHISLGAFAMRPLKKPVVQRLTLSDPNDWPPILVTRCEQGYVIIDGYHRQAAAQALGEQLRATCQPYASETAVMEATFAANLTHGSPADLQYRSKFAYYLFATYPDLTQVEIAQRTGITQSGVSRAIAKQQQRAEELNRLKQMSESERERFEQRQRVEKSCHTFVQMVVKLLTLDEHLDNGELFVLLNQAAGRSEDKAKLAQMGRLLTSGTTSGSLLRLAQLAQSPSSSTWQHEGAEPARGAPPYNGS